MIGRSSYGHQLFELLNLTDCFADTLRLAGFGQLLDPSGRSGEAVEPGRAARALERVGNARQLVEVLGRQRGTHRVQSLGNTVDELDYHFANCGSSVGSVECMISPDGVVAVARPTAAGLLFEVS